MEQSIAFEEIELDSGQLVRVGRLPDHLMPSPGLFEALWDLHPEHPPIIHIHGKNVPLPRWQQAYGRDYQFSGAVSSAHAVPDCLLPLLDWARGAIDPALNGLLLNWYDGRLGHYIGKHRDSRIGLVEGSPIVGISFGEARLFRFQKWHGTEKRDLIARDGSVIVIPEEVNRNWTHAVPKTVKAKNRRVSITLRAFI